MYNGIGVQTARGTGTSGHVTKSLGALKPVRHDVARMKETREKKSTKKEADPGIVYHNSLRNIEVVLCSLRDELEDEGVSETEIEEKLSSKRTELRRKLEQGEDILEAKEDGNSHSEALRVEARNAKLADALGIRPERTRSRSRGRSNSSHR